MEDYIKNELNKMDKGLVATPTAEYLNDFAKANNGSNDFLLMQMAKNYGYKLALLNIQDLLEESCETWGEEFEAVPVKEEMNDLVISEEEMNDKEIAEFTHKKFFKSE